jgi:hypothetical protein
VRNSDFLEIVTALYMDSQASAQALSEAEQLSAAGETSEEYGVTVRRVGRNVCLPLMQASLAWRAGDCR